MINEVDKETSMELLRNSSDWISYLISIKSDYGVFLIFVGTSILAAVIALVELVLSFKIPLWTLLPDLGLLILFAMFFMRKIGNEKKEYNNLIEQILNGKLITPNIIKEKYIELNEKIKEKPPWPLWYSILIIFIVIMEIVITFYK